jgi:hypothetical protein
MSDKKYLVLLRNQPAGGKQPSPEQMQQMYAAYSTWMETFQERIADIGTKLAGSGKVLTAAGVADGPFIEAKEVVGGYMIVSAPDYERALEVVQASPMIHMPGISLEVREMVSM